METSPNDSITKVNPEKQESESNNNNSKFSVSKSWLPERVLTDYSWIRGYALPRRIYNAKGENKPSGRFVEKLDAIVSIFCDAAAFSPTLGTWPDQFKDPKIFGAFGIHPHNAKYYNDKVEERIIECLKEPKAIAYGEIGLDFHYNHSPEDVQKQIFERQLKLAATLSKPVIIHSRKAEKDTIKLLKSCLGKDHKIHIHMFQDSESYAKELMADFPNVYFGMTGVITYSSAAPTQQIVKNVIPLDRSRLSFNFSLSVLLETDSPYIAPAPLKKGTMNHPGYIPMIADKIAQLQQIKVEKVIQVTRENTFQMYGI